MDYKKIMDKEFYFPDYYNSVINKIADDLSIDIELKKELFEKRNLGLDKYGEYSFQATFKNALLSPSEEHLEEEMIDAINYILHSIYKSNSLLNEYSIVSKQYEIAKKLVKLYLEIKELNKEINGPVGE